MQFMTFHCQGTSLGKQPGGSSGFLVQIRLYNTVKSSMRVNERTKTNQILCAT